MSPLDTDIRSLFAFSFFFKRRQKRKQILGLCLDLHNTLQWRGGGEGAGLCGTTAVGGTDRTDGQRDGAKVQSGRRRSIHALPPSVCAALRRVYGVEKVRRVT